MNRPPSSLRGRHARLGVSAIPVAGLGGDLGASIESTSRASTGTPLVGAYYFGGYLYYFYSGGSILEKATPQGLSNKTIPPSSAKYHTLYQRLSALSPIPTSTADTLVKLATQRSADAARKPPPGYKQPAYDPAPSKPAAVKRKAATSRPAAAPAADVEPYTAPEPATKPSFLDVVNDNAAVIAGGAAAVGALLLLVSTLRRPRASA